MTSVHTVGKKQQSPWMRRLHLPAYQVKEAARYAGVSSQTILNWQGTASTIGSRDKGVALSYLQLIEVAVVAALRQAGVSLNTIRVAKEYVAQRLNAEFPFAQYTFKTDGKELLMALSEFDRKESNDKLIVVSKQGQLGWKQILDSRLKEFEYQKGLAVKWRLGGANSSIIIDPQVSFGAPAVKGVPTWTIRGRLDAGESIEDIADDFSLDLTDVRQALKFEGIDKKIITDAAWSH
jgi:uncharacterized protein (DUF433 family)